MPAHPSTDLLLTLLADDSPKVERAVAARLRALGKAALPALTRGTRHDNPRIRARSRDLLIEAGRRSAVRRLAGYATRARHELHTSLALLDAFIDPGQDRRPTVRAITAMGQEFERRLRKHEAHPAKVLSDYLYGTIGFSGTDEAEATPAHASLARAIETRCGMPLVLCALWSQVAAFARVRTALLPVPGHVVLLVRGRDRAQLVDPFGDGELIEREHILGYLEAHHLTLQEEWLQPASASALFLRHTLNTAATFRALGRKKEVRLLSPLIHLLAAHPEAQPLQKG